VQILGKNTGPDTHEISSKASLILKRVEVRLSMVEEDVGGALTLVCDVCVCVCVCPG
jgi:hypothetical protein